MRNVGGCRSFVGIVVVLGWCVSTVAFAEVTEPDGTVVPTTPSGDYDEVPLQSFFDDRGESIDSVADAFDTPNTFSPLCDFQATFVLNEATNKFGIGWYNVNPASTDAPTVYEIIPANAPLDTVFTGADIRADENYAGGLIGFALMRSPRYFTERRLNRVCTACSPDAPWIMSLTYVSTATANAFYLGFEDGDVSASSFGGNDGDFNDDLFFIEGVVCGGAGEPCTVDGAQGVCADGITSCVAGGLACVPLAEARDETCDGFDNDCNGEIDDGDLCDLGRVCHRGSCVPPCSEFGCLGDGEVCANDICVDEACIDVQCEVGEVCDGGTCRAACDGVTCPGDQICRVGVCIDACAGVACPEGLVCEGGACVTSCDCAGCEGGAVCQGGAHPEAGRCVDAACVDMECAAGTHCEGGACVDDCDGAVCPDGQACEAGACTAVTPPTEDAGPGGPRVDAGGTDPGNGGDDAGTGGPDAGEDPRGPGGRGDGGCGCRVAASRDARGYGAGVVAVAAILTLRRRRRRRA